GEANGACDDFFLFAPEYRQLGRANDKEAEGLHQSRSMCILNVSERWRKRSLIPVWQTPLARFLLRVPPPALAGRVLCIWRSAAGACMPGCAAQRTARRWLPRLATSPLSL